MISESSRTAHTYLSDLFRDGTPAALGDSELLDRFTSGRDEQDETAEMAFAALLARHGPMVLRVCRAVLGNRHEVEDAFQATFLVLAVRARSIRRRGSLASWLHGVALRVAAAERSRAARRQRHELVWAVMNSSIAQDTGSDLVCDHEMNDVIHEEIGRLPGKHRAAVVLCYLEGLTHEMAAERLRWPVGSVKSRLAWARDRLCVRLTRRGVAPTSLSADRFESSRNAEPAPIPVVLGTQLTETTLSGALKAALGKRALAGIVSAEAVPLMEATMSSMAHYRLMLAATAALAAALATAGLGTIGYAALRQENPQRVIHSILQPPVAQAPPRPTGAKPAADQGPVVIQVDVVDSDGHRLSGVDVVVRLSYSHGSGNAEQVTERTRTDGAGHVKFEAVRERQVGILRSARAWAYQPGRALATSSVLLTGKAPPPAIQLKLDEPANWTITVLGADDRPIEGIRLVPHSLRRTDARTLQTSIDAAIEEPLTVTTDAKGFATLSYLAGNMAPLSIGVAGPGVAPQTVPLDVPQGKNVVLKLGRPGRVVGIVRTASGQPLAGIPVELWVQGSGTLPSDVRAVGDRRITGNAIVRLDQEPLKTGLQGAFQTPSTLLNGSTYLVSIRQDGFVPFSSDWVTLNGERAAIPDIRLRPGTAIAR